MTDKHASEDAGLRWQVEAAMSLAIPIATRDELQLLFESAERIIVLHNARTRRLREEGAP